MILKDICEDEFDNLAGILHQLTPGQLSRFGGHGRVEGFGVLEVKFEDAIIRRFSRRPPAHKAGLAADDAGHLLQEGEVIRITDFKLGLIGRLFIQEDELNHCYQSLH